MADCIFKLEFCKKYGISFPTLQKLVHDNRLRTETRGKREFIIVDDPEEIELAIHYAHRSHQEWTRGNHRGNKERIFADSFDRMWHEDQGIPATNITKIKESDIATEDESFCFDYPDHWPKYFPGVPFPYDRCRKLMELGFIVGPGDKFMERH
jgi:hypothetical protein